MPKESNCQHQACESYSLTDCKLIQSEDCYWGLLYTERPTADTSECCDHFFLLNLEQERNSFSAKWAWCSLKSIPTCAEQSVCSCCQTVREFLAPRTFQGNLAQPTPGRGGNDAFYWWFVKFHVPSGHSTCRSVAQVLWPSVGWRSEFSLV